MSKSGTLSFLLNKAERGWAVSGCSWEGCVRSPAVWVGVILLVMMFVVGDDVCHAPTIPACMAEVTWSCSASLTRSDVAIGTHIATHASNTNTIRVAFIFVCSSGFFQAVECALKMYRGCWLPLGSRNDGELLSLQKHNHTQQSTYALCVEK